METKRTPLSQKQGATSLTPALLNLNSYGPTIHGLSALQCGFLVAFTQLIPEHQVQLFSGALKARVKRLPGIYLLISNALTLLVAQNPYIIIQFGFFTAWVYLRFVKVQESAGGEFRGDRSETFAFTTWFPPVLHRPIGALGNTVFRLCVRLRLVQPWGEDGSSGGAYQLLPGPNAGPGGARAEAERRRALALKALDARLASAPSAGGPSSSTSAAASTGGAGTGGGASTGAGVAAGASVSAPPAARLEEAAGGVTAK